MRVSLSLRKRIVAVCIAAGVFSLITIPFAVLLGVPLDRAIFGASLLGLLIGIFEQFYAQGPHGRALRAMHPLKSLVIYSAIIVVLYLIVLYCNLAFFGELDQLSAAYGRIPVLLPFVVIMSVVAVTAIRIVGFLGARNLFFLMIGKYFRPLVERKVFLFLDIKGSTGLVEKLGALKTRALIGTFFFDISKAITDHGGEIYRFTGDGVVAVWDWESGTSDNRIVDAIDDVCRVVQDSKQEYLSTFGHVPEFRVGVHGGEIVISEEGDTKRAIGFYGDTIHIAARLEQKAKELGVDCLLSEDITEKLSDLDARLRLVEREPVRGMKRPIGIYELKVNAASE